MRPSISLVHRAVIGRAVQDYAPGYVRRRRHRTAEATARAVVAYDLRPLTRRYGRRAVEAAALELIRAHPETLARTRGECDSRQRTREHHAERLAAAAVRAYGAGNLCRAALLIEDAEIINPRFDWSGYRAMLTPPAALAAAG